MTEIPKEVALLIKVGAGPEATSSNVTPALNDWYDLEDELIMVFERPKKHRLGSLAGKQKNLCAREGG